MKRLLNLILFIMFLPLLMIGQEVSYVGNPDDSYFKARELAFAGHHHSARDTLEKILSRYPDYTDVRSLLAKTYSWDANYEEARKHLNRITSAERKNKEAWLAAINNEVYAKNLNIALGLTQKTFSYLEQTHERPPSAEEIAKELDMTISEVKQSMKNSGRHISMDAPLKEGEDSNLYDVMRSGESPRPDIDLMRQSLHTEINRALDTLSPREADVIKLYYGIGDQQSMTLAEIGQTFDLTRERVRQIREKAIRKLRHNSRNKLLKSYLG